MKGKRPNNNELQSYLLGLIGKLEDNLEKEEEVVFSSQYGVGFYDQYIGIMGYININNILPALINPFKRIKKLMEEPNKISNYIDELLNYTIIKAEITGKRKRNAEDIAAKITNCIDAMIQLGKEKTEELQHLSNEFNNIVNDKTERAEEDLDETNLVDFLEEIDYIQRVNASFVLSLYAIIDFYSKGFIIDVISTIPQKRVYNTQNFDQAKQNPVVGIKWGLKELEKNNPGSLEALNSVLRQKKWRVHEKTIKRLKEIRNGAAHQDPIVSLELLQTTFPQYSAEVHKELDQWKAEIIDQKLPSFLEEIITSLLDYFEVILFLQKIGKGCLRYLALVDGLMSYHKNKLPLL